MHKHRSKNAQRGSRKQKIGPTPLAGKLWIIGLIILLLGLCDVTARFCDGLRRGDVGILLLLAYDFECLMAGATVLTGGALLLDYAERREARKDE